MLDLLQELDLIGWAAHFAMVSTRLVGLFVFLPLFGSQIIPIRFRITIAAVLAFAFLPVVPKLATLPLDVGDWTVLGLRELLAGFGLGMAARVLFAAIEGAAGLVAGQTGFAMAMMVNPADGQQVMAPSLFINLIATTLFLTSNLHYMVLTGIIRSYELMPPALTFPRFDGLEPFVGAMGIRLFTVSVQLAAPALILTIAMDLVMVLVGKAMPQIPILVVAYPFKLAAGLLSIAVLAMAVGTTMRWIARTMMSDGAALVTAFAGR